jgi:hypothetical protein
LSQTDYASDLLGGEKPKAAPMTDYASDLMGPTKQPSFGESLAKKREEREGSADFGTLTKASMVEDPQTKLRIFSKARFPKLDEKEALSRYGVVDGDVLYVDDDGKIRSETANGIKNFAAGTVANLPAIAGGIAGSVAGAPGGPPGVIGLGALGAAGGKGYGKVVANLAFDEPQTVSGNLKDMGTEAIFEAGGNLVGVAFAKALTRGAARDIGRFDAAKIAAITAKAQAQGIDLNVAQSTDLPSLKAKYDVLASMPTSRDILAEDAVKQSKQAYDATERFLAKISPVDGLDEAGAQARQGAKKVIAELTKERAAAASPLYKKAFEEFQGIPPEFKQAVDELSSRPSMQQASRLAARIAKDEGRILENPQNSLIGMHYTKLALDKMIGDDAKGGFSKTSRGALIGLKKELVEMMDHFSPTYKQARETFTHFTPNIQSVEDGIISRVAGLGDEQAFKAAQMMFGGNTSPVAVDRAKRLFDKAGLKGDWDAMLRAHLQDTFEMAGREFKTTGGAIQQASNWRIAMAGNPRQYRVLEKAMDPVQWRAFNDLSDVFEAMGRTAGAGAGSQTMTRQEGGRLLRNDAGSGIVGQAANLLSPQNFGTRASAWLSEVRLGNHAEKLAEIMTSPDGIKKLRDLRKLSPNDQRFIAGASSLFGISLRQANKAANPAGKEAEQE